MDSADQMTEEALMSAYRGGDRRAFEQLFAILGPRVHGFFMRSFQSRSTADDLLQTTFMKCHRARNDYRSDQPLRPWVFSIAARVRLDEYRRRKIPMELLDEETLGDVAQAPGAPATEREIEDRDLAARVRAALQELPESQRVIVHLHRFEGLAFAEIATALGTTEGAVKLRAFRAYAKLRVILSPVISSESAA